MNRPRAKVILAGYRPGPGTPTDPEIVSALALVERDPELARWFEREQAVDAALHRKLQDIPVPLGLRERILQSRPIRRAHPAWWRMPMVLSAAAAVFIALGTWTVWTAPWTPQTWQAYQSKTIEEVTEPYALDLESRDHDQVRRSMAAAGFPSDYRVPPGLLDYPLEGGRRMVWRGHKVAVVCFGSDAERKPDVWLIVLRGVSLPGSPTLVTPEFATIGDCRLARWAEGDELYIVATLEGPDLKLLF